ncbi:hypothetical protein J6590_002643 [Homalodisca vitripennis]|nr:hypothetical protein J6590_002643 [Homalodisca vitripennis]
MAQQCKVLVHEFILPALKYEEFLSSMSSQDIHKLAHVNCRELWNKKLRKLLIALVRKGYLCLLQEWKDFPDGHEWINPANLRIITAWIHLEISIFVSQLTNRDRTRNICVVKRTSNGLHIMAKKGVCEMTDY